MAIQRPPLALADHECPLWVKSGNARPEHLLSAHDAIADIATSLRHVRVGSICKNLTPSKCCPECPTNRT